MQSGPRSDSAPPAGAERTSWSRRATALTLGAAALVLTAGLGAMAVALGLFGEGGPTPTTVVAGSGTRWSSQPVQVGEAGRVLVEHSGQIVRVASVEPADGWTWTADGADPGSVALRFESQGATYEFTARVGPDGTVQSATAPVGPDVAPPPPGGDGHPGEGADRGGEDHHTGGDDDFPKGHDDDD